MSFFEAFMCPVTQFTGQTGLTSIISVTPPILSQIGGFRGVKHRRRKISIAALQLFKTYLEIKTNG
jgi:hypothetical protein